MSLYSEADIARIEASIRALEKNSATELVVAVVPRSADYWQGRLVLALGWSLAAALAALHFLTRLAPEYTLLLATALGFALFMLFGRGAPARLLLSREATGRAVERRAFELFAERGLNRTRERTGMLILISELERRVVILGDQGIHERVGDAGWREHVDHVIASIQAGKPLEGLLRVIERLGAAHAERNPVRPDDTNELSDEVIRG